MQVTLRLWGPVPSSSGEAEYSPLPVVRLKPAAHEVSGTNERFVSDGIIGSHSMPGPRESI